MIQASVVALLAPTAPARSDDAYSTDWAASTKSQARLVAVGEGLAGFEIQLTPGAITYWRDPGDAGAPPIFDFSGSDNVVKVEPVFPAPQRIAESDGSEAFGYEHGVVLPLRIVPHDPARPVTLVVHANYAVCEKICLPAQARLKLTLSGAPSPYARLVEAALAAAPRAVPPEEFGDLSPDGADGWRLCAPHAAGTSLDLFVEAPEGWRIGASPAPKEASRDCFRLTVLEKTKDADLPIALRLTMTGGRGPVETTIEAQPPK
ncbi:MAG TPA: protein-disulfide reductase DsbD domain-containing protein [Roseiarcus sp.]|nr:protein-disulfide reductase DsbD domain-containing protein [Roseiarcus sp.]